MWVVELIVFFVVLFFGFCLASYTISVFPTEIFGTKEVREGGCLFSFLVLIFSCAIIAGPVWFFLDKGEDPVMSKICGIVFFSALIIFFGSIILRVGINLTTSIIYEIGKETERLKQEQELRRRREKEERERRAELEKRERFKHNLIATGLFYESDPWEKLYDDVDNM